MLPFQLPSLAFPDRLSHSEDVFTRVPRCLQEGRGKEREVILEIPPVFLLPRLHFLLLVLILCELIHNLGV